MHYRDAEFNVTKVAGTEGLDLAAGNAGGGFPVNTYSYITKRKTKITMEGILLLGMGVSCRVAKNK